MISICLFLNVENKSLANSQKNQPSHKIVIISFFRFQSWFGYMIIFEQLPRILLFCACNISYEFLPLQLVVMWGGTWELVIPLDGSRSPSIYNQITFRVSCYFFTTTSRLVTFIGTCGAYTFFFPLSLCQYSLN